MSFRPRRAVAMRSASLLSPATSTRLPADRARRLDRLRVLAVVAGGVFADQVTKALAPDPLINQGGTGHVLPDAVRLLWTHPHAGAALDLLDVVPLALMCWAATRARDNTSRLAWCLLCAGFTSNWADRIGLAALTQPGSPRGAVDWIRVGGLPGVYNLADVLIVCGALVLLLRSAGRLGRPTAAVAGTVLLCLLAVWVGVWSGDRRAAQSSDAADRMQRPLVQLERERLGLESRIEASRAKEADAQRRTAQAALAAHDAGVADAELLLPPGHRFTCRAGARGPCVVVADNDAALVLVYPLHRPPWAAGLGVPAGVCDRVTDQVRCAAMSAGESTEVVR